MEIGNQSEALSRIEKENKELKEKNDQKAQVI